MGFCGSGRAELCPTNERSADTVFRVLPVSSSQFGSSPSPSTLGRNEFPDGEEILDVVLLGNNIMSS